MISSISSHGSVAYAQQQPMQKNIRAEEQDKAQGGVKLSASEQVAQNKYQVGIQILEASFSVSISSGKEPQSLLYSSAVDHINQLLEPELGPNALQNLASSQDNSPEATAGRILSFSTGFYDMYAKQHPGEDPEKLAQNFVDIIRGGFEKGFNEAKDILQGLQVFNGDIAAGVMKTYELVQQGYDQFLSDKLSALKPTEDLKKAA